MKSHKFWACATAFCFLITMCTGHKMTGKKGD